MTDLDLMSDDISYPNNDVKQIGEARVQTHKYIMAYNRKIFDVEVLSGELPEDNKVTLRAFGAYAPFWGSINDLGNGHYRITVHGSD